MRGAYLLGPLLYFFIYYAMPDFPFTVTEQYRPNVALLLINKKGKLLVCERLGQDGAWQFPQGGVDEGEGFLSAFHREVSEEIGLDPEDYTLLDLRAGYRYKYPLETQLKKQRKQHYTGQEQTYFLCELTASAKKINLDQHSPEFQDLQWIKPKDFCLDWLPEFKREVYRQVMLDFFSCKIS